MTTHNPVIDEIFGRLQALEVIATTALGLYIANSRNDPDFSKATTVLEELRSSIAANAPAHLSPSAAASAVMFGDAYIDAIAKELRTLRGGGGKVN